MKNITFDRHRRLRSSKAMRSLVRETELSINDLIYPLFVSEGHDNKKEVPSMPNVYQLSLDHLLAEMEEIESLGIQAVMLFGIPAEKDAEGSGAYDDDGIVQQATRLIKKHFPDLLIIPDTCTWEYTSHGH